jgi:hypothetical protein
MAAAQLLSFCGNWRIDVCARFPPTISSFEAHAQASSSVDEGTAMWKQIVALIDDIMQVATFQRRRSEREYRD